MSETYSEEIITDINSNVFFKEFTFNKNDFCASDGNKQELADNIVWLDDLFFIIQIKERDVYSIISEESENKWFESKVLKKAKKQISNSVDFLKKNKITVKNARNHSVSIEVPDENLQNSHKLIIYMPNSSLISEDNKSIKFYNSQKSGNIHIFDINDYHRICRILITPSEVGEYLEFRERFYIFHKNEVNKYTEKYLLSHFVSSGNEKIINAGYLKNLQNLDNLENKKSIYQVSGLLKNFLEKICIDKQREAIDYYLIIKEIAKLNRNELREFDERFSKIFNETNYPFPYRFVNLRTGCGFIFLSFPGDIDQKIERLSFCMEVYKYKRRLNKCLGVSVSKTGEYHDLIWSFMNQDWVYDNELEKLVKKEEDLEVYSVGEIKLFDRYNFSS